MLHAHPQDAVAYFRERSLVYKQLAQDDSFIGRITIISELLILSIQNKKRIFIVGNGGSAAEAQHFAAELVGRFRRNRPAIAAIALTTDTSILTAQSNDVGFTSVFSRQIEAFGQSGDVLVVLTTSDFDPVNAHSENLNNALHAASRLHMVRICFGSYKTKILAQLSDHTLLVPSGDGAVVQEVQLACIHYLCDEIERRLYP